MLGKRVPDKLVAVHRLDGSKDRVCIHIEISCGSRRNGWVGILDSALNPGASSLPGAGAGRTQVSVHPKCADLNLTRARRKLFVKEP